MAGPLASAVQGAYNKKAAEKAAKLAKEQQTAGMQLVNELDYQPMYASENVPTFQRSQSPIARSYLESVLAGNNPSSTFSGAPNAKLTKQRQQADQNRMFGTMEERVAAQRAMEQATPWKVTPPTRRVNPNRGEPGGADWIVKNTEKAGSGITRSLNDALLSTGTDLDAIAQNRVKGAPYSVYLDNINNLLETQYDGDADRLAADIRAAGGLDKLSKRGR